MTGPDATPLQIDIVSDVVCPWCIIGYRQLEQALRRTGTEARIRWHPFELNPDMPPEGENLRDHLIAKYGITAEQSRQTRDRLTALGAELGFDFAFTDDQRMVNTFRAHQLLDWADGEGRQTPLQLELFRAHFTEGRDVSDGSVLVDAAGAAGLDREAARRALASGAHAAPVREKQRFWTSRGISGVPAVVLDGKYLLSGAQGIETFAEALRQCRRAPA